MEKKRSFSQVRFFTGGSYEKIEETMNSFFCEKQLALGEYEKEYILTSGASIVVAIYYTAKNPAD